MLPPLLLVSIGDCPLPSPLPPIAARLSAAEISDSAVVDAVKLHGIESALLCFPQDDTAYLKAVHVSVSLIRCG
jgi:hypothetical protein